MTNSQLKVIAVITMLIDHVGAVFFPDYLFLRVIGRIAFPIYAFLLVEGYFHTRDVRKYILRLGIFALISEIPFDLAFFQWPFYWGYQNVFFTLMLAVMVMHVLDEYKVKNQVIGWLAIVAIIAVSVLFRTDYNILGILTVLIFYYDRGNRPKAILGVVLLHGLYGLLGSGLLSGDFYFQGFLQAFIILAMPLIYLYNGEKGRSLKYFFYAFYPVHLALIALVYKVIW